MVQKFARFWSFYLKNLANFRAIKPRKSPQSNKQGDLFREFWAREDVRFVMLGRPTMGKDQEGLIARMAEIPKLEYLGEELIERVKPPLAKSYMLVNTSFYEGFSNTFT